MYDLKILSKYLSYLKCCIIFGLSLVPPILKKTLINGIMTYGFEFRALSYRFNFWHGFQGVSLKVSNFSIAKEIRYHIQIERPTTNILAPLRS